MVKRILSLLVALTMIFSLSASVLATEAEPANKEPSVDLSEKTEETAPESLSDVVSEEITENGKQETLAEEPEGPFERGTFTLTQAHKLIRKTGTVNFESWGSATADDFISGRVYNNSGDPREEAILQFTTAANGLNDDDKVVLTFSASAQDAKGVGATIKIVGVADENYEYGAALPTVDSNYSYTTDKLLTVDFTEFSFDVTSYVKARLASGVKKISFLVEIVDSDWESGSTYMDLAITSYNILPTLTYKATPLKELSYDGNDIEFKEGQMDYTVMIDDGSLPVVAADTDNATVEVTQTAAVPGTATVTVTKYGSETTYKVNFITSDYIGTANASAAFYSTRKAATGRLSANLTQADLASTKSTKIRTDSSGKLVQDGVVTFDIKDLLGVNPYQKVILTVFGNFTVAGSQLEYRGVSGEGVKAGGKYGTNVAYTAKSEAAANTSVAPYTMDVTEYVKAKLAEGEETISFALRLPAETKGVTFNWYFGSDRKATLTVKEVSTELTDIMVNGESIADFSSLKTTYTHYIADDFVGIPSITVVKKDNDASQYIELPEVIPGTAIVEISNPAGKSTVYTIKLKYESSKTNPTLYTTLPYVTYKDATTGDKVNALAPGGKIKAELNLRGLKSEPDITFVTALYNDGFLVSKVSSKKTTGDTSLVNTIDIDLTDVSKATVKSFILNGYGDGKNIINCASLDSSDNTIKSLTMTGYDFTEFNPDITDYVLDIPASVVNYPEFTAVARDSGAKLTTLIPVYLPGVVKVSAEAGNGETKVYTINLNRADAKITNLTMDYTSKDNLKIIENIQNPVYDPVPVNPPVEGKEQGADFNKEYLLTNCQNPIMFAPDKGKQWIAKMDERFEGATLIALPYNGLDPSKNASAANYYDKTGFIEFDINRSATVYVVNGSSSIPTWAINEGFENVTDIEKGYVFETAVDGGVNMKSMPYVYSKYYSVDEWSEEPVTVSLGSVNKAQYWWVIVVFDK